MLRPSSDIKKIAQVLNRDKPINAIEFLIKSYQVTGPSPEFQKDKLAIGFDTNSFLRVAGSHGADDVIDYLRDHHKGPLIIPGQAIQEFWKNDYETVRKVGDQLNKKFDEFRSSVSRISDDFGDYARDIQEKLESFDEEHGNIYETDSLSKTLDWLESVKEKAIVPFAPRAYFADIAVVRKRTKTPPGFKDKINEDGDFYIWVDFLLGLHMAKKTKSFTHAVLVTNEKKPDWNRNGMVHPILAAEVHALFGIGFETWDINKLVRYVRE